MLPSGKPDYQAVRQLSRSSNTDEPNVVGLRELFADVLQIDADSIDPEASFVDLGGNSLTYVTMSVRLERALGRVARGLAAPAAAGAGQPCPNRRDGGGRGGARRWRRASRFAPSRSCSSSVRTRVVRAVGRRAHPAGHRGIQLRPVLPHTGGPRPTGCGTCATRSGGSRCRRWSGLRSRCCDHRRLHPHKSVAGQQVPRPARQHDRGSAVVRRSVGVDSGRAGRRCAGCRSWTGWNDDGRSPSPWGFWPLGLALRYDILGMHLGSDAWFTVLAFWFFAIGWAAAKASTALQRAAVTIALIISLHGYFDSTRARSVGARRSCVAHLVADDSLPARGHRASPGVIAEASLYTYLTHYQVYPAIRRPLRCSVSSRRSPSGCC